MHADDVPFYFLNIVLNEMVSENQRKGQSQDKPV